MNAKNKETALTLEIAEILASLNLNLKETENGIKIILNNAIEIAKQYKKEDDINELIIQLENKTKLIYGGLFALAMYGNVGF